MAPSSIKLHQTTAKVGTRVVTAAAAGLVTTGLVLTSAVLAVQALDALRRPLVDLDTAVAALAGLAVAVVLLSWCCGAAATAALVLLRSTGREHRALEAAAAALAPVVLRRLVQRSVALALGLAVAGGAAAGPALAAPEQPARAGSAAGLTWPAHRPATAPPPAPPSPAPAPTTPVQVVVRPGDTLWGIARDALPDGATTAQVATTWPAWYAANRGVIGDDPDLLRPGQRLSAPGATS